MQFCDGLRRYYKLEYEISDLVVIDSGDHIDFQSDMFRYKENGLSRIELTKEERDELIETTMIGKKSSFHLVFNRIHFANISSLKEFITTYWDIISRIELTKEERDELIETTTIRKKQFSSGF